MVVLVEVDEELEVVERKEGIEGSLVDSKILAVELPTVATSGRVLSASSTVGSWPLSLGADAADGLGGDSDSLGIKGSSFQVQ